MLLFYALPALHALIRETCDPRFRNVLPRLIFPAHRRTAYLLENSLPLLRVVCCQMFSRDASFVSGFRTSQMVVMPVRFAPTSNI